MDRVSIERMCAGKEFQVEDLVTFGSQGLVFK